MSDLFNSIKSVAFGTAKSSTGAPNAHRLLAHFVCQRPNVGSKLTYGLTSCGNTGAAGEPVFGGRRGGAVRGGLAERGPLLR